MPDQPQTVTCTEHVRSNLLYGVGVIAAGVVCVWLLLFPLFDSSVWLLLIRWVGIPVVGAVMVMGVIQILNYFHRRLEMDDHEVRYTNCLGLTHAYPWGDIVAYDRRKKDNELELVFRGHPRTFHKTSVNFDQMLDFVIDHTELISDNGK